MKKNKFAIGIPTINRFDLLKPALQSYIDDFGGVDIHILDNGKQDIKNNLPSNALVDNVYIHEESKNLGVAGSWNKLCDTIFQDYDFALILNDDIYLGCDTETVNRAIERTKVGIVQSDFVWSVILISRNLFKKIGRFDEEFYPAYFEDSDYIYRIKLAGLLHEIDYELSPLVQRTGSSTNKDRTLFDGYFQKNRERYIAKWGNSPLLETFTTPFGI